MSTDDNPVSPPPLTAAEIASIEAGIYAGNTVPLKLERAIGQAAQSKAFIEIDINGVPMLVGPDSILGDAHTQGSLLHTYEQASRAPRKGDANPSGRTMEDILQEAPEWKEREAQRPGGGMVTATEAAVRDMDTLMGKLETCRQSPISMAGWLEQATKLTPLGAKLDTDRVLEAAETAMAAEWSHTSGVSKGLWNRTRNVVTEADMQLRTYGQILELDYSVINSRQPDALSRGR